MESNTNLHKFFLWHFAVEPFTYHGILPLGTCAGLYGKWQVRYENGRICNEFDLTQVGHQLLGRTCKANNK